MSYSLRSNLVVWLCVPLCVAAGLLLLDTGYNAHRSANSANDNSLYASALAIADRVVINGAVMEVDLPYIALEMLSATGDDHVYYTVIAGDDAYITGYKDLPGVPARDKQTHIENATFFDSLFRGQEVRVAELRRTIHRQSRDFDFTVYVAKTVGERNELTRELTLVHGSRLLLLVLVVVAFAWIGTSRALRPVDRLRQSLERRSYYDLRPVAVQVPSEMDAVVAYLQMLGTLVDFATFDAEAYSR